MVSKNIIIKELDNAIIKCGRGNSPRESSGVIYGQGEAPQFEPSFESKQYLDNNRLNEIADAMSERWGLEVSVDEKGKREIGQTKFRFWDARHGTIINLDKMVKQQYEINFTNNPDYPANSRESVYTLDEVLGAYNELDSGVKTNLGELIFDMQKGASYCDVYNPKSDMFNVVRISSMIYNNHYGDTSLKRILNHECGHAGEANFSKEQMDVLRKAYNPKNGKYSPSRLSNNRELEVFNDFVDNQKIYRNQFSYSKEYRDAMDKNKLHYASHYSSTYGYSANSWIEDYAETMSAVSYRNSPNKEDFKIRYPDGRIVGYDEFVSDHESTFKFCCDVADGKIKHTDLHHPTSGFSYNK